MNSLVTVVMPIYNRLDLLKNSAKHKTADII